MSIYAIGLMFSIAVYIAVGSYAGRKVKHLDDYFVAGRNAPTLLIVGTLVASLISTNAFMGESGQAYAGFPGVVIFLTAINVVGYVVGALYFGRFLRRNRSLTLAEYFGQRFNSRRVQAVAGITIIGVCTTYVMAISQGVSAIISQVSGLSFGVTLLLAWVSYTLFTLYSGSRGVIITDTLMFALFGTVAFVGLAYIVEDAGGWFETVRSLAVYEAKPGILTWHGANSPGGAWQTPAESFTYAVILGLAWSMVVAVSPWQASRYLMARDEQTVIRSAAITAAVIMVFYLVLMLAAAAVNLINPDIEPEQEVMIWAAMNVLPTLAGVALMAGIMAAGLSSASTFLSLVGFSVSNDILPVTSTVDKTRLRLTRWAMLGASLTAVVLAWFVPQGKLFWLTYFAGTLFASSWGPVGFMSVWSRRITEAGAFWGIIAGVVGNVAIRLISILGEVDFPEIFNPILVGALLSYITVVTVSRGGVVTDEEHRRREAMHQLPDSERNQGRVARTLTVSGVIFLLGPVVALAMIFFYALPAEQALIAAGEPSGSAMLFSLGIGFAIMLSGAWSWWGTRRSYLPD